jgi:hypothetical protein
MNEQTCCPEESIVELTVEEVSNEDKELTFLLDKETNASARLDICKACPELIPTVNMCSQCKCFMNIKTRIYSAACPLGKW